MAFKRDLNALSKEEILLISSLYDQIRFKNFKTDDVNFISLSDLAEEILIPQSAANADFIDAEEWVF